MRRHYPSTMRVFSSGPVGEMLFLPQGVFFRVDCHAQTRHLKRPSMSLQASSKGSLPGSFNQMTISEGEQEHKSR